MVLLPLVCLPIGDNNPVPNLDEVLVMVMSMVSLAGANEEEEKGEDKQHFEVFAPVSGELEENNYLTWEGQSHCWREFPN